MTAVDADRTARVLIVEDDESMAELVGEELADEGGAYESAASRDEDGHGRESATGRSPTAMPPSRSREREAPAAPCP